MPQFTIDLSQSAVQRLQALTERYNADQGAALTVQDWISLHLKELAVADDLAAAAENFRRQAEADANAALLAERRRLLDRLEGQ